MVRPPAPPARLSVHTPPFVTHCAGCRRTAAADGADSAAHSSPSSSSPPVGEQAAAGHRPGAKAKSGPPLAGLVSYGDEDDSDSADNAPPSPSPAARSPRPAATPPPPPPPGPDRSGWVECVDPTSGESYYWHRGSQAVQWTEPDRFLGIDGREHGAAAPQRRQRDVDASQSGLATELARLRRATQLDAATKRACPSPPPAREAGPRPDTFPLPTLPPALLESVHALLAAHAHEEWDTPLSPAALLRVRLRDWHAGALSAQHLRRCIERLDSDLREAEAAGPGEPTPSAAAAATHALSVPGTGAGVALQGGPQSAEQLRDAMRATPFWRRSLLLYVPREVTKMPAPLLRQALRALPRACGSVRALRTVGEQYFVATLPDDGAAAHAETHLCGERLDPGGGESEQWTLLRAEACGGKRGLYARKLSTVDKVPALERMQPEALAYDSEASARLARKREGEARGSLGSAVRRRAVGDEGNGAA